MNLSNFWDASKIRTQHDQIKNIFFYRVCGMGMGTCAKIVKEAGYSVEGADYEFFPPMSTYLKETGITCVPMERVDQAYLAQFDLIVVGNSIKGGGPDALLIEGSGTPFTSFPCLLGELVLAQRRVVGIAGTHGKTTTSYYLVQMLESLGLKPGYLIGGVLDDRASSMLGNKDDVFVIESDEYDSAYFQKFSKFRQYNIKDLILTSLEFDHADIFDSVEDIEEQFYPILGQVQKIVGNHAYPSVQKVMKKASELEHNLALFPFGEKDSSGPQFMNWDGENCEFRVFFRQQWEVFKTNINGEQNLLNITACIKYFEGEAQFSVEQVKQAVSQLRNVKRRQEIRGKYQNAIVVDDFAHHPTSMELTIDCVGQKFPDRKMIVVVEPVTSTARSNAFQESFPSVFHKADQVLIANPGIDTNAKQFENLDYNRLAIDIDRSGIPAEVFQDLDPLLEKIKSLTVEKSVLLVCSNRTVLGLWKSDFVNQLNL
jgi:UDP-N-acetylmuramate: L-alanyl-gamma-D-glutamyl-meso-diaminopimelate ligase